MLRYVVNRRCSTRKALGSDEWINLRPGQRVDAKDLPAHTPLDEWVASGHLSSVKEKKA